MELSGREKHCNRWCQSIRNNLCILQQPVPFGMAGKLFFLCATFSLSDAQFNFQLVGPVAAA